MEPWCQKQNELSYGVCTAGTKIGDTKFNTTSEKRKECRDHYLSDEALERCMHKTFVEQCNENDNINREICWQCGRRTEGLGKLAAYECIEEHKNCDVDTNALPPVVLAKCFGGEAGST